MNHDISLWSPVIIASLAFPRTCHQERHLTISPFCERIDDVKVRIREPLTVRHGKALETRMNLEIIVLLEETNGRTVLISHPEVIKERLSFEDFDILPQSGEGEIEYITQIQDLHWNEEQQGNEIIVNYSLTYMVLAVQEQVVRLYAGEEANNNDREQSYDLNEAIEESALEETINDKLKHKVFLYEKDIISLQRAIKKTEERNALLNRELHGTQQLVQTLRDAVTRKDLLICHYENRSYTPGQKIKPTTILNAAEPKLGQRLRRMFMNSL